MTLQQTTDAHKAFADGVMRDFDDLRRMALSLQVKHEELEQELVRREKECRCCAACLRISGRPQLCIPRGRGTRFGCTNMVSCQLFRNHLSHRRAVRDQF